MLELARLRMPNPYSLFCERPPPLVPRERVFGIRERMSAEGETLLAPGRRRCRGRARRGAGGGLRRHRRLLPARLAQSGARTRGGGDGRRGSIPTLAVFCGSEVWPAIREYERTTTAVLNAYVHPRIAAYLERSRRD